MNHSELQRTARRRQVPRGEARAHAAARPKKPRGPSVIVNRRSVPNNARAPPSALFPQLEAGAALDDDDGIACTAVAT